MYKKLQYSFLVSLFAVSVNTHSYQDVPFGNQELQRARYLYIEMLKKTILNTIYEPATFKEDGSQWPKIAHTMIGKKRLDNIQFCIEQVLKNNIPGDFIETGVWRGGATILMRGILKAYNITDRIIWAADSFEGLPKPDVVNYPVDSTAGGLHESGYFLAVSLEQVKQNFAAYDLLDNQVRFLKGYFKDTMPNNPIERLAILRLDGDMYESTIQVLENLFDKVSIGGYIIVDDWTLIWAQRAIIDFRAKNAIDDPLQKIDNHSVYWQKTKNR